MSLRFWKTETFKEITTSLASEGKAGNIIPSSPALIFRPLLETPLHKVKVVMLFPGPYHKKGVANGQALGYNRGVTETYDDAPFWFKAIGDQLIKEGYSGTPRTGDLRRWSAQGVLLWNAAPTTIVGSPNAHFKLWEDLTQEILETVYLRDPKTLFVFWGPTLRFKAKLPVDLNYIAVPLPGMVVHNAFGDYTPFGKINERLKGNRIQPPNWNLN